MKKLALTSLLAVFAATSANAANVINGDPLYMPSAGHFYSVTELGSHTENTDTWGINEEFGYGITDRLSVAVGTEVAEKDWFDNSEWGYFGLQATYRVLNDAHWKADVYGAYAVSPVWGDHESFLDKDETRYTWLAGVRAGYTTGNWTVAGHATFEYTNEESFGWNKDAGERGFHTLSLGVDGLYSIDSHWSVLAGAEYTGVLDKEWRGISGAKVKNEGEWDFTAGVNYNIDATKFVGLYAGWEMNHQHGDQHDSWGFEDGFEFGAKFGIDF